MSELLYDALMMGRNKQVAREEYLVARGQKEPAGFEAKEKTLYFSDITSDTTGFVHLTLEGEGYLEIESYCADSCIAFSKKVITSDDFKDGTFDFSFTVLSRKVHNGKNCARISFRTPLFCRDVDIIIDNKVRIAFGEESRRQIRMTLCRDYLDLRMGKLFEAEWQEKTEKLLESLNETDAEELFMMLYRANVLITQGKYPQAKNLIEFVADQSGKMTEKNWDLISYFMYVSSMYEMDEEVSANAAEQVWRIYDEHPSWIVLWTLFYTDSKLNDDPEKMLDMMRGEFLLGGCKSPVIYFEAVDIMKRKPELLKEPGPFEIQALYFAARENFLNLNISMKLAEVVWDTDEEILKLSNLSILTRILKAAYDKFESNIVLKSLCKLLVAMDERRTEYHKYFARAIKEYLETREIYNYYLYTADRTEFVDLPKSVMEHFVGNDAVLGDVRAYFFDCVICGRKSWMNYYLRYLPAMGRFANDMASAGIIDKELAYLYSHLMDENRLNTETYAKMLEILCTKEIRFENSQIAGILVFHREFKEYQEVIPENGRALVKLFAKDAVVLFKDITGNLYCNINHEENTFLEKAKYIDLCIKNMPINRYLMVGDQLTLLKAIKEPAEILEYLFRQMGTGGLRSEYEQEILKDMIMYFSRTNKDEEVSERLLKFVKFDLDTTTRGKLIEVMIDRRLFKEAMAQVERYGYAGVDKEHLTELAHVAVELTDYEEEELLSEMCCECFMKGDFDPVIFEYMKRNYNGETEVLLKMYSAASAFSLEDPVINERLVRRMIEEDKLTDRGEEVFAPYFEEGDDKELKKSFIIAAVDKCLYQGNAGLNYVFPLMERMLLDGEEFPDRTKVCFLVYMGQQSEIEVRTSKLLEGMLESLVRRGIMLEEFKKLKKFFPIPKILANTYTAGIIRMKDEETEETEISTKNLFPGAPRINYEIRHRDTFSRMTEPMKEIFEGCFIRSFTLFFGEALTYNIDGGTETTVSYSDLEVVRDGSRYADLDNMIQLSTGDNYAALERAAIEYYIKGELINNLF